MSFVFRILRFLIPVALYTILVLFLYGLSGAMSLSVLSFFSMNETELLYKGEFFTNQSMSKDIFYFIVLYAIFCTVSFYFVLLAPSIPLIVHDYYIGDSVVVGFLTVILFPFVVKLFLPDFDLSFKGALVFGLVNVIFTALSKNHSRFRDEY